MKHEGYLAVKRDVDPSEPFTAGSQVEIYPLLESIDDFEQRRKQAEANQAQGIQPLDVDVEALARETAEWLRGLPDKRRARQRGCDCSPRGRRTPLAVEYGVDSDLYVWVRGTILPRDIRNESTAHLHEAARAWRIGTFLPFVAVTCCRLCHVYWAVLIDENGYRLVKTGRSVQDASVQDA